jgi:hypothetical protein
VKRLGLSWNFSSPAWMLSPLELRSQTGNSAQQTSEDEPVSFVCRPTRPAGDPTARAVADKLTLFFCPSLAPSKLRAEPWRALRGLPSHAKPDRCLWAWSLDQPFPLLLLPIGSSRSPSASQHHNLHRCSAATLAPRASFHGFNVMVFGLFMCECQTDTAWNPETRALGASHKSQYCHL